jgi:shikimate dehydrogenase
VNNNMPNHDRYAVFGNPIHHSKSPALQMAFAQQTQQDMMYTAECIPVDEFKTAADQFFNAGGRGLNITVPFKLDAFDYAHELTPRAKKAGAVNTLIKSHDTIIGDNTDGVGFVNDVTKNLQWVLKGKRILVLGAGGAVRGILEPLLKAQPKVVVIANRTREKAKQLAIDFMEDGNISGCHYSDLHQDDVAFDIIINGTSASLSGDLPNIPHSLIHQQSCCYDMMYGKSDTVFMRWAKKNNAAHVADGLGMLVCQGAESFYQWRRERADTQAVIELLRITL